MKKGNDKKAAQLGMPIGTASGRLRKSTIFKLLLECGKNYCYQCGGIIVDEKELSIEHKIPYLDSLDPIALFFDLDNIAFSHLTCNIGAARRMIMKHPSEGAYNKGCRCDDCRKMKNDALIKYRAKIVGRSGGPPGLISLGSKIRLLTPQQ